MDDVDQENVATVLEHLLRTHRTFNHTKPGAVKYALAQFAHTLKQSDPPKVVHAPVTHNPSNGHVTARTAAPDMVPMCENCGLTQPNCGCGNYKEWRR
jgi:hypothetical protein